MSSRLPLSTAAARADKIFEDTAVLLTGGNSLVAKLIDLQENAKDADASGDRFKVFSGRVPKIEGKM